MHALPPPEILAHLTGPGSNCVISHLYTDEEAGNFTTARCNGRRTVIARDLHGDMVRQISGCSIMLTIEGVRFPRLLHVSNCSGAMRIRQTGDIWTRQLLAAGRIARSRLEGVQFYPVARQPACYRIAIAFTLLGMPTNAPLEGRSATRCASPLRGSRRAPG